MTSRPRRTRNRRPGTARWSLVLALVLTAWLSAGCGVTRGDEGNDMTMMIPNSPGGGYDQTGRAAVSVLERDKILDGSFEVTNVIGAGGSVAMTRLMNAEGDNHMMMTAGLGVVGSLYSFGVDYKLQDATPLAQLIEDQEGVLVPADSPYKTIDDFLAAWKKDPGGIAVGGGSSPGGPDHLFPMQLASAVGIDPRKVRYVSYDGGGPLTSALLGHKIKVGFSGVGEFEGQIEAGELRLLAVSGDERLTNDGVEDAPTLQESGVDLTFTNWRGVLAPPGISEERRQQLIGLLEEMHDSPEWQQALEDNGWIDAFKTGDEFTAFLEEQDARVADTLKELELL
ncbi:tripartite tricarboxylate transporter substrate binding protein [Nocardioides guangzhouensis]|uniref:Tripartite tricarboxylate transporter substrate binding protein n=1 Tax=Nocardioides guangzhouensis TaxID=2497878 RepID=A0A4Q4ZKJ1_9ACTN|nr:tripartite tricarboxylate transporter substrate-binding protein [Nocardioides guangzhouensis]RYP88870.1 tripartite tricarboxylate transporter substrate binding protein [Nocardioides guangzhouensis]